MGFLGVRSTPKNPSKLFLPPPRCAQGRVGEGEKSTCDNPHYEDTLLFHISVLS